MREKSHLPRCAENGGGSGFSAHEPIPERSDVYMVKVKPVSQGKTTRMSFGKISEVMHDFVKRLK